MVKNTKGGKKAKSKSKKKMQEQEEMSLNLITPQEGTIICKITKVHGYGRYLLETLKGENTFIGISRHVRMASKLRLNSIVLASFRECNTIQKEIDILLAYTEGQVQQLVEYGYINSRKLELDENEFEYDLFDDEMTEEEFNAL
jgi:hypothetical protein